MIKCQPDADGCIDLLTVLRVINQVNQEQVWAICYELATLMRRLKPANCAPIDSLAQIHLHKDGYVHEKSCSLAKLAVSRSSASTSSSPSSPSSSVSLSSSPVESSEDSGTDQMAIERPITSTITTTTATPTIPSALMATNRPSKTLTTTNANTNRINRAQPHPTSQLATTTEATSTTTATTTTTTTTITTNRRSTSEHSQSNSNSNNNNNINSIHIAPNSPQPPTPPITPDQLNQILGRQPALNETELVASLGIALFWALDYGIPDDEERKLNMAMEYLIFRSQSSDKLSLDEILDICTDRLAIPTKAHASSHYREVCRRLIDDTIELSIFLEKIYTASMVLSDISLDDCFETNHKCDITDQDLSHLGEPLASLKALRINDWARLWMQVIRELRQRGRFKQALAVS